MFKFKSLAVIAACAAAMVLVSCEKEKEKEFPITPGETQLTTTAEGGEISLSVICEQSDWQWSFAEEDASQWCTGKKDKDKLVLTVAPNYTGKDRSLTIILSSSNSSAEVVLTQGSSVTFYKVAVPDFSNMDAAENVGKSLVYEVSDKDGKVIGVCCATSTFLHSPIATERQYSILPQPLRTDRAIYRQRERFLTTGVQLHGMQPKEAALIAPAAHQNRHQNFT